LDLELLEGELAIVRLDAGDPVPEWVGGKLVATVRTGEELSIVCAAEGVPPAAGGSRGWRALRIAGTMDLALTGVLARLLEPLAAAEVPIFAISSFDTDYVLVPGERLAEATQAIEAAGHGVGRATPPSV
jgi:hypothetical protein